MSDDKELYDRWLDLLGEYRRRFGHPAMSPAGGGVTDLSIADGTIALQEALERDEPFSDLDISDLPPDVLL